MCGRSESLHLAPEMVIHKAVRQACNAMMLESQSFYGVNYRTGRKASAGCKQFPKPFGAHIMPLRFPDAGHKEFLLWVLLWFNCFLFHFSLWKDTAYSVLLCVWNMQIIL